MNRVIIFETDRVENDHFRVADEGRLTHLHNVIGPQKGDLLKVSLLNSGLAEATVISVADNEIILKASNWQRGIKRNISLLVGLSRPPTCKKILEHATAFGVDHFEFFKAELSEKSYLTSKLFQNRAYEKNLLDGLAQGGKFDSLPKVEINQKRNSTNFKQDQKFVLTFNSNKTFLDYDINFNDRINLAIGPERGWTKGEEELLLQEGWQPVTLGSPVLRVEMATFAALGQLEMLRFKKDN